MIIFRVLSEEVNGMDDKITTQRRRDMTQALNFNMAAMFHFFIDTINKKSTEIKSNVRFFSYCCTLLRNNT